VIVPACRSNSWGRDGEVHGRGRGIYAAAFTAGFAEKPFRELVRRLTQALFGSSEKAAKSGATVHVAENGLITLELSPGLALQISAGGVPGETSPNGN